MKKIIQGRGLPETAQKTLSRRNLLDWMGKGAVLALGGKLVAACDPALAGTDDDYDGGSVPDGGITNQPGEFPFRPGELDKPVFKDWGERTVDAQELEEILKEWRLVIDGMVEQPVTLNFADIIKLPRTDLTVDFHCVEGWSIYDVPWNGVHMSRLFEMVKPENSATHITFHTIENIYNESIPIDVALEAKTLLAYGIGGSTIPLKHGFPLRLVIPRKLAYKSAKYVYRLEFTDEPIEGYWVKVGYPYEAEVPEGRLRPGRY